MVYEDLYKARRIPKLAESLAKRCHDAAAGRQEKQRELFWAKRNPPDATPLCELKPIDKKRNVRAEMLVKWKAEKLKKLEEEKKKKKPIFKVGVIQRSVTGSPIINKRDGKICLHPCGNSKGRSEITQCGMITRSRARNANNTAGKQSKCSKQTDDLKKEPPRKIKLNNKFCKIDVGVVNLLNTYKFNPPQSIGKFAGVNKLTYPNSPNLTRKCKNSLKVEEQKGDSTKCLEDPGKKEKGDEIFMNEKAMASPLKMKPSEKESMELKTPDPVNEKEEKEEESLFRPIFYSPFVTVRSGRKSQKKSKLDLSSLEQEIREEENIFNCRIFSFRKYIECETKRLLNSCDHWKSIMEGSDEIPADAQGEIDSIIGKTKLLTSDKFIQFKNLIDNCEKRDPMIKLDDLQGFQDWISIEVERIDTDFGKLEKLKNNNWILDTKIIERIQKPKQSKHIAAKPVGKSNIRSHIEAMRKKIKGEKTSDISTGSPSRQTIKHALLKNVLESPKINGDVRSLSARRNSGLEILAASRKSKISCAAKDSSIVVSVENHMCNSLDTPGKSILKKATPARARSKNKVTFQRLTTNTGLKKVGLDQKYFEPVTDNAQSPEMRRVLHDLNLNGTPLQRVTRSRAHRLNVHT